MTATPVFPTEAKCSEECTAALGAKDPDELLKIVQELNQALKREEQVRRDFREAMRANKVSA
jgi:hypothetical protein